MDPLITTIGLSIFILVVGAALILGIIEAYGPRGVRYQTNQLLIKVAVACLNRVEFRSPTNRNMIRVVRNETNCLKGCV